MAPAGGRPCPAQHGAQGNAAAAGLSAGLGSAALQPRGQAAPARNAAGSEQGQGAPGPAEPGHKAFSRCQSTP